MEAREFGEYLKSIRKLKKMTIRQLELYSGVSNAYISQLERGERNIPSPSILEKLAKGLNTDYEDLMIKAGHIKNPSYIEPVTTHSMVRLPILGSVRAGDPLYIAESIEGYEYIPEDILRGREGFLLRVKGDSMSGDRILDGDLVVVIKQDESMPHEIAVVSINYEEATLKRVKCQDDNCILSSSNPKYEPMFYKLHEVNILGIVERVIFKP